MKTMISATIAALAILGYGSLSAAADGDGHKHKAKSHQMAEKQEVMVHAKVNGIDKNQRTANISHGPVKELSWPAMTMDMKVADGVALADLHQGQEVMVALAKGDDGIYLITKVMIHGH